MMKTELIEYDFGFIGDFHPNYQSSNELLESDDLERFIKNEIPNTLEQLEATDEDFKELYTRLYKQAIEIGDRNAIIKRINELNHKIYNEAYTEYLKENN